MDAEWNDPNDGWGDEWNDPDDGWGLEEVPPDALDQVDRALLSDGGAGEERFLRAADHIPDFEGGAGAFRGHRASGWIRGGVSVAGRRAA